MNKLNLQDNNPVHQHLQSEGIQTWEQLMDYVQKLPYGRNSERGGSILSYPKMNYLIMKNDKVLIGLFQGMFENNIITFNLGWNENAQTLDDYDDVRKIQAKLKEEGLSLAKEIEEGTSGPGSIMVTDPDGNTILIDQHI